MSQRTIDLLQAFLCMVVLAAGCHAPPRPESETPFESGNRALAAGEHVTATAQFTLAIENAKDYFYTRAYLRRGESHLLAANKESDSKLKADHLGLARRDFDAVLSQNDLLSEEEAEALEKRGVILAQQADWARAEESFTRILGLKLPQGASDYHVTAYRQLGRILLQRALAARKEGPSAEEELEMQENFRKAQERFSIGLQINKEDEGCNLGKGICLHFRGQNNEAITYLEKSTSLSGAKNSPNPKGHFYLARAYEMQMGLHIKALEHYHQAVSEDVAHEFTPLYAQLVAELNRNVFFGNPEFDWFFRSMLSYRGNDPIHSPSYWEGVEALAVQRWIGDSLEKGGDPQKEASREPVQTGIFARALARARIRKVEDAVKDALLLNKGQSFSERLEQIFPVESVTSQLPQDVYGKALTLLKAKRHEELEQFFESEAFRAFAASATKNEKEERDEKNAKPEKNEKEDYYRRTILLEGRNIVEMWEDELKRSPTLTTDVKIERDKKLGRARDIFQSYLRERRDDNEIRMQLGRVQELMDSFATAYLTYELLTKESKHYPAAFHSILKLHRERLLTGKDLEAAWKLLLDYDGDDKSIKEYVQRTKGQLEADASLYCLSCGRKGTEGDTLCVECGHPIGLAALPVLPGRGPVDSEK